MDSKHLSSAIRTRQKGKGWLKHYKTNREAIEQTHQQQQLNDIGEAKFLEIHVIPIYAILNR